MERDPSHIASLVKGCPQLLKSNVLKDWHADGNHQDIFTTGFDNDNPAALNVSQVQITGCLFLRDYKRSIRVGVNCELNWN